MASASNKRKEIVAEDVLSSCPVCALTFLNLKPWFPHL